MLAAWEETSIVDDIFRAASMNDCEFIVMLKTLEKGDRTVCGRLSEIAASLEPSLPGVRGRKVSAASAAHEFLLEKQILKSQGYTFSAYAGKESGANGPKGDFTDPMTGATRTEFGDVRFDPRAGMPQSQEAAEETQLSRCERMAAAPSSR